EKQAVKRHTASQSAAANARAQQDRSKASIHDQQKAITAAKSVDGRLAEEPLTREDLDGGIRHSNQLTETTTVLSAMQDKAAAEQDAQESLLQETMLDENLLDESLLADLLPDTAIANNAILPSALANQDRKSTRLNSSHVKISYAVFCLKKKTTRSENTIRHAGHCAHPP